MPLKYLSIVCIWFTVSNCSPPTEQHSDNKVVYDGALTDTFFLSKSWSYNNFTEKREDGTFEFTMQHNTDTSHHFHTANLAYAVDSASDNAAYFQEQEVWDKVKYGKAYLVDKTLILEFDELTQIAYNNLKIKIKNGYFTSIYLSGSPAGGNRYYDFEESSLILQKETVTVGDTLRGYLDCKVRKPHYCHLKGAFKVKVLKNDL